MARRRDKRKRWVARKKANAAEERQTDREARIEKQAEILIKKRLEEQKKPTSHVEQATQCKPSGAKEDGHSTSKKSRVQSAPLRRPKEINETHIVKTTKYLGSGTFGICYLAFYRGMTVVVKELKSLKNSKTATDDAAAKRTKEELLYEADIIRKLGDHPGLPLLFGVCSRNQPYKLILQFHGEAQSSLTIARALHSKRITTKREWDVIVKMSAEALHHVHSMGFLHNDLKSNNIIC